jgi:tRNA(Ile)-lysidine synthase
MRGRSTIGPAERQALFRPFDRRSGVLLAVSGGADSTALLLLAAQWRDEGGATPLAIATIDHAIRPESAAECDKVAALAHGFALPCRVLKWEGDKPSTRLQERAREARHALLARACLEAGADAIALAHTLDDQAETVLMRLARGSGPEGLAAMRPAAPVPGFGSLVLLRPLLGLRRETLAELVRGAGIAPVEDPSNRDRRFERVRVRDLLPALEPLGLTPQRLVRLAERSARLQAVIEGEAGNRFLSLAERQQGMIAFDGPSFAALPEELRLRLLHLSLAELGSGRTREPRLERLEALERAVETALAGGEPLRRTLAGMLVTVEGARITLRPEPARRHHRPLRDDQS